MVAEYLWYKSYDKGVPHSLEPYPQVTFLDVVEDTAAKRPDNAFLIFKGRQISYARA